MHISHQLIGLFVAILALVGTVPYIVGIFKGVTHPSRAAYAIWVVIDILTTVSYFASGARATVWLPLAFTLTSITIFCLSFKYGMGGYNKLDLTCMGIAALAIVLWITTNDPVIALYTSLFAKLLGYIPVIKKSYLHPHTENTLSWAITAVASTLNILALTTFKPQFSLLPISLAITDTLIALLLLFPTIGRGAVKVKTR